jgi:hypothetical protein
MEVVYQLLLVRQASDIPAEKRPHPERPCQKHDNPNENVCQKVECLTYFFEFGDNPLYRHDARGGNDHTNETMEIEKKKYHGKEYS